MSFKSHIPFHRQITGSLVFLYLSFIVIVGFASFLLYQRNVQISELIDTKIPEMEFSYQYKEHLKLNNDLVSALHKSENSEQLVDAFTHINGNLKDTATLKLVNVRSVNQLITELDDISNVVERIVANDSRNQALKQTSIVQLNVLVNSLVEQIDIQTEEQRRRHKKVTMNGANGYIPAGDAIEYVEITRKLNQLTKTSTLLDDAIVGFEQLSIKNSVDELEEITRKVDLAITTWLSALGGKQIDIDIRRKIQELQSLLNKDQRVLGKWYSHLRLSEEVFNRVQLINQKLAGLYPSINSQANLISSDDIIPDLFSQVGDRINFKPSVQEYHFGLITLLFLSLVSVFFTLFRFRSRVKVYGENTVNLCSSILSDTATEKEQNAYVKTAEQLRIVGLIKQIQKPENSQNQNQNLISSHNRELNFINAHHHIVNWQYKPSDIYIDISEFLAHSSIDSANNLTSWRHLFTRTSLAELIVIAKSVRDSKVVQSYGVKLNNGVQLEVLIGFDGTSWFGTLSHHKKFELLKKTVISLKNKNKTLEHAASEELSGTIDRFSQMILRAMIQSQGGSLDVNGSSLSVYRQLTRMLDWCNQTNLVTQLQTASKSTQTIDIKFKDELHAAVFNAMSEAHLQKNRIYLTLDSNILPFSNVNSLLFNRMLTSVIRIILAELFNATLKIGLRVIDSDVGKQTVQFSFTVIPAKALKMMPDLVLRLLNEDKQSQFSSDIIVYINTLMERLNINQVQGELNDANFKVMFNMPLVAQDIHPVQRETAEINLNNKLVISLGACQQSQKMIENHLKPTGAGLIEVNTVEELTQEFTVQKLEDKHIDLLIVNDDIANADLERVKRYQRILPRNMQPKLFVMQSSINPRYHKHGLYNQVSTPLIEKSFYRQLDDLLKGDAVDNLLIETDVLKQYQYLPTRVEVLLAVAVPEEHQLFINILQWLGLQVHVVSQPESMLRKWQSGRYLVLLSEFSQSPFIMLSTGRNIQRGIFTFKQASFERPTGRLLDIVKHWKVSPLPNVLDIKELVTLLEPWLKLQTTIKPSRLKQPKAQSYVEFLNESSELDDSDKAYLTQYQLLNPDIATEQEALLQNEVLDMDKFALNQGSSELAAYMLDEYLDDIAEAIRTIDKAITEQSIHQIHKPVHIILKLSEVMGASNLNGQIKVVKELLSDVSTTDFTLLTRYNLKLRTHLEALRSFSDAI